MTVYYRDFSLPETGLLIYESKHQNGGLVAKHHHKIYQILYAIDGAGTITLDDKAYHFGQNQISYIVPFTNHSIESHSKLTVLVLSFREESLTSMITPDFFRLLKKESFMLGLNPVGASDIKLHLKKMLFEQRNQDPLSTYAILTSLMNVLITLERSRTSVTYTDANTLRAERMRSYLETHYFKDITTKDLAALFEISVRYVNEIFKERFKMTPMQYLGAAERIKN